MESKKVTARVESTPGGRIIHIGSQKFNVTRMALNDDLTPDEAQLNLFEDHGVTHVIDPVAFVNDGPEKMHTLSEYPLVQK